MNCIKIKKRSAIKEKISCFLKTRLNRLENFDNCEMGRNGEFELCRRFCEEMARKEKREVTVFDIGANVGNYSETFISEAKKNNLKIKIHAFEPSKSTFAKLKNRFASSPEVILINSGLSDENGNQTLYEDKNENNSGGSSLYNRKVLLESSKIEEKIQLVRLDSYIKEKKVAHIDFMKLDVEGHELFVLKGMGRYLRPDFVDFIQFEFGGCNFDSHTTLKELIDLLEEKNFVVGKIMPKYIELMEKNTRSSEDYTYSNYVTINPEWISK